MPTIFDIEKGEFVEFTEARETGVIELNDSTLVLLKGDKGDRGESRRGERGLPGRDGKDGINGRDGKDGLSGKDAVGIPGKDGKDGIQGLHGKDAPLGKDGLGIASITQPSIGKALITYTDGKTQSLDIPAGKDGAPVEMGTSSTHIQWRYKGEKEWRELLRIPKAKSAGGGGGGASIDDLTGILLAGANITLTTTDAGKLTVAASSGGSISQASFNIIG